MPDFETILDQVSDLCTVLDRDGTVRYAASSAAVLGEDPDSLVGESLLDRVHPDDRETVAELLDGPESDDGDEADDGGGVDGPDDRDPVRFRLRHADGTWVRLETDGECPPDPDTGGVVLVAADVTERWEHARAVDRYEAILDSLDDGVYAVEPDGTVVYVNDGYASMKGVDREELVGSKIDDWGTAAAREVIHTAREAVADTDDGVGTVEFEFSTADGGTVPVEMRFNTVPGGDTELERTGMIRDVSEREARERALRRKNERLEAFASVVSHDLRNPLNVAGGRLDLARRECDSEHLDDVDSALDRMETLIDDILALAREGEAVTETAAVDLAATAEAAWENVATADATLVVETDAAVAADRSRLQQLLENLVRNAVEHGSTSPHATPSREDAVEHGGTAVTVTVGDCDDAPGFFVADDGVGVPRDERDAVFEAGYSTAADGTGFGLGIVEQIVQAHGWTVDVTESADGGARFEITGVESASG